MGNIENLYLYKKNEQKHKVKKWSEIPNEEIFYVVLS